MTAIDMLAAISGTKSLSVLDGLARTIWTDWADQKLTDDQAGALAETLERRKREVRGVDTVAARAPQVTAAAKGSMTKRGAPEAGLKAFASFVSSIRSQAGADFSCEFRFPQKHKTLDTNQKNRQSGAMRGLICRESLSFVF
jgi:hypothetical protein